MRCWQVLCSAFHFPRGSSSVHFLVDFVRFGHFCSFPPVPVPRSASPHCQLWCLWAPLPLLGDRSLLGPAPSKPSSTPENNQYTQSADALNRQWKQSVMRNIASDSQRWNWPHSYCVVKCGAFWWRTFKQTRSQCHLSHLSCFLRLSTVCIYALSTQNSTNISQKPCLTILSPECVYRNQISNNPRPFPVNQLRRRLLLTKLRRFSFASTNHSPLSVAGQNCVDQ